MPEMIPTEIYNAATRAASLLTTSLNEALADCRTALSAHPRVVGPDKLGQLDDLLAEFARRRVRIAIYGEVKAGKSTLINALSGAELSPMAFDPLTSVPLRVTYGSRTQWRIGDVIFDDINELAGLMRQNPERASEVVVETRLDLLQLGGQVDLLDTPGVGSEARFDTISANVLRSLDAVVLVVRYPALFTQMTRTLTAALDADIGKLFVVWNIDAACQELSPTERATQAEALRTRIAGIHELYMVDAREGFRAAKAKDEAGMAASGLSAFGRALAAFAASEKRPLVALREAAKRADDWLGEALGRLKDREKVLRIEVGDARERLSECDAAAERREEEARSKFTDFQETLRLIGENRATAAAECAQEIRRQFQAARAGWVRNGEFSALEAAVAAALVSYADGTDAVCQKTRAALQQAGEQFGTVVPTSPRLRSEPAVESLSSADRIFRANTGRVRRLRRALWKKWYLPGLMALESDAMEADLQKQTDWFNENAEGATNAASALLDSRLGELRRRHFGEREKIKAETKFDAIEAEFNKLSEHVPLVVDRRAAVSKINSEARSLID